MNILFILYRNDAVNSALHIHGFANALIELGHDCVLAIPDEEDGDSDLSTNASYPVVTFHEAFSWDLFHNCKPPDIIHAWTPREVVRKQSLFLRAKYQLARLVVHLEDNEEVLTEKFLGAPIEELKLLPASKLNHIIAPTLSHPIFYKEFLDVADGVTGIIDTLFELVPNDKPNMILWPIIDSDNYYRYNGKQHSELKNDLGIKDNELVICYPGNIHTVNKDEITSLYLAVALAKREGMDVKLLRIGDDHCDFFDENCEWTRNVSIELAFIPIKSREKLLSCLALSEILIQPGKSGKFNDYRLPSKLPEFLAMGKPVILPNSNIGQYLKDEVEALILQRGDGLEILDKIKKVYHNKELIHKLSHGAHNFAVKNFDKSVIGKNLENFYYKILGKVQ